MTEVQRIVDAKVEEALFASKYSLISSFLYNWKLVRAPPSKARSNRHLEARDVEIETSGPTVAVIIVRD